MDRDDNNALGRAPSTDEELDDLLGIDERGRVGEVTRLAVHGRVAVVADSGMRRLYGLLRQLARAELPVLVTGETGVGKELAARAIHGWSSRSKGAFVALNCAALPDTLIDSELFGHRRGAFTGADRDRVGFLEAASGGTLFLDEIGELPLPAQAKLLRALDSGQVIPVGSTHPVAIDVRVVAATHRSLPDEIERHAFRVDLYYRLCAATVTVPPLRDRPLDIGALARGLLEELAPQQRRTRVTLSGAALRRLEAHSFPGNVRELVNIIRFALATTTGVVIDVQHLPSALTNRPKFPQACRTAAAHHHFRPIADEVAELESSRMRQALSAAKGNQSRAAKLLGMPRRTFTTKMGKYGLRA